MKIFLTPLLLLSVLLTGCTADSSLKEKESTPVNSEATTTPSQDASTQDAHTYARPDQVAITHLNLDLTVDFEKQQLSGYAQYDLDRHEGNDLILDVRNLEIEKVLLDNSDEPVKYELGDDREFLGQSLTIPLEENTQQATIYYRTIPGKDEAVDWLVAEQTAGKEFPFLFTQGQSILTRTWIPIQDSPGIRITYEAVIRVPKDLLAVMSAENPQELNESGIYQFSMPQPIPPYLLALAVGRLNFKAISERTGVYAEPSVVDAAADEFSDMEKMLEAAEGLYGPYLWGRYDVIVLPPSFPFGGMENPRLTFATPTILAGDRSLTSLIAHELAHSWSGNLVTNATWDDFWLNEGFTVYFERRIMEALYGADYAEMLTQLGLQDLHATVQDLGLESEGTQLKTNLKGKNADDGMTDVPYEKGSALLMVLEEKVGREKFDAFLKKYFSEHQFQVITTEEFITYLNKNLLEPEQVDINLKEWIYQPGLPADLPEVTSARFAAVDDQLYKFKEGAQASSLEVKNWTTHEWLHFIRGLDKDMPAAKMADLDDTFAFHESGNSEILAAWLTLSIHNGHIDQITPELRSFLNRVGRRKFLIPLYKGLIENDRKKLANDIYQESKTNYHAVSRNTIEGLLNG